MEKKLTPDQFIQPGFNTFTVCHVSAKSIACRASPGCLPGREHTQPQIGGKLGRPLQIHAIAGVGILKFGNL